MVERLEPTDILSVHWNGATEEETRYFQAVNIDRLRAVIQDIQRVCKESKVKENRNEFSHASGFNRALVAFVKEIEERFGVLFK